MGLFLASSGVGENMLPNKNKKKESEEDYQQ
jgi:hypothetical protein